MIRLQPKEKLAWSCSKPAHQSSRQPVRFFSGYNNDCDDGDDAAGSTSTHCNSMFGYTGFHRNSYNSHGDNTRYIPGRRNSRTGMRGNRIRLLRDRLKPERQLVLLEPEPARLLPTEVKEVFS
jgi:hypothetical protein